MYFVSIPIIKIIKSTTTKRALMFITKIYINSELKIPSNNSNVKASLNPIPAGIFNATIEAVEVSK